MSRSYKKHPIFSDNDGGGAAYAKRVANQKVRHYPDLVDGGMYKKVFCSYEIHDYRFHVWTKDSLHRDSEPIGRPYYRVAPQPQMCYKDLQKTKTYRDARMK